MGIYSFGLKMLKSDLKQCIFYLISIIFSVTTTFSALSIMNNSGFVLLDKNETEICSTILFALMLLLMAFVIFSNSYFLIRKSKELAFTALSGVSLYRLSALLFFQNIFLGIIGIVIGLVLGVVTMPLFLFIMYKLLNIDGNIYFFSLEALLMTFFIIGVQIFVVSFGDLMYLSGKEIKELINGYKMVYQPDTNSRMAKYTRKTYVIVYFLPLILLITNSKDLASVVAFINVVFSVFGTQGLIRHVIPEKINQYKEKIALENDIKLVSLSNLYYALRKLEYLILILSITSVSLICVTGIFKTSMRIKTISISSYISVIVIMAFSIIYKVIVDAENRKHSFKQLCLIGYTVEQLKKIIKEEVVIFYGITILIPLFHILIYTISFIKVGILTFPLSILIVAIFTIILVMAGIISYFSYKKLIFNYL